jgi:hypothetical protein
LMVPERTGPENVVKDTVCTPSVEDLSVCTSPPGAVAQKDPV